MSGSAPRDGIVVGVDGPPASEAATALASDEASRRGAVAQSIDVPVIVVRPQ